MTKTSNASIVDHAKVMHGPSVRARIKSSARNAAGLLIDAHVHAHECFEPAAVFDNAARNFSRAGGELNLGTGVPGCLLLTENPEDEFFDFVRSRIDIDGWRIEPTDESCSLLCRRPSAQGEDLIVLIAGRQIVVREGIEVLALCCDRRFPVGRSLKSTLEGVLRAGAVPVLPWGFGKWWFSRGALVRKVLDSGFSSAVWLGDNGNRLRLGPTPRLFSTAVRRGVAVLPGSDPLPMRGRDRDVGRYGFVLHGEVDLNRPAAWIKAALHEKRTSQEDIQPFGRRETIARFCASQIAMQLRKKGR